MRLHVATPVRWSDLDAYGHVNNARLLSLLEEARIQAFWMSSELDGRAAGASTAVLDAGPGAETITLIARQEIEYLAPIPYHRLPLDIQLWIGTLGGASLEVCYEVWNPIGVEPRVCLVRASTTIVLIDPTTQRPRRIRDIERAAWAPYLEAPVQFRGTR
ncbi:MAG TPA: thioesterase family protein [Candidatus Lumbricidophila sp.]|nr:thioesterase family protein [Candidatus Lumbricidophila sp.]